MHETEKMGLRMTDRPHDMTPTIAMATAPPRKRRHWPLLVLVILNFLGLVAGLLVFAYGMPVVSVNERIPLSAVFPCLFGVGMLMAWSARSTSRIAIDDMSPVNRVALAVFSAAMFAAGIYAGLQFRDEVGKVLNDTLYQVEAHTFPGGPPAD